MATDIRKYFGKNLKSFRKLKGLSQEKFAELIGVDTSTLSKIECCKSYPNRSTIEKIIDILNIPPYLLYVTNEDDFDIEKAYIETIELLKELKNDRKFFKLVYDFIKELCNKNS